jgi:hypothetical protein
MPIHDWKRVSAGTFHHFHYMWIAECVKVLSDGLLPAGYYAFADQSSGQFGPDVLNMQRELGNGVGDRGRSSGLVAVAETPPKVSQKMVVDVEEFARRSREIVIRHISDDRIVAIVEIVSRGNKSSHFAFQKFIDKAIGALYQGIHLLIVDLQPPTARDPFGIHAAIWSEINPDEDLAPPNKPLTLVSYSANQAITAYVEPVAVGDALCDMPLFLEPESYINLPLESTYMATWRIMPPHVKAALEK